MNEPNDIVIGDNNKAYISAIGGLYELDLSGEVKALRKLVDIAEPQSLSIDVENQRILVIDKLSNGIAVFDLLGEQAAFIQPRFLL